MGIFTRIRDALNAHLRPNPVAILSAEIVGAGEDRGLCHWKSPLKMRGARGLRAVLVITGQGRMGGGVIRSAFAEWMHSPALRGVVSGFTIAHQKHGGNGAFYVTLKRRV